jgi:hypothetical protein
MASEKAKQTKAGKYLLSGGLVLALVCIGGIFLLATGMRGHGKSAHAPISALPTIALTPKPLFADTFTGKQQGWYTGSVAGYTRIVNGNGLMLADTNHQVLVESLPTNKLFDDFSVTIKVALITADANDSAGFYVRGDSNLDHDYRFEIFGNDTYAISKESLDTNNVPTVTPLIPPTPTSLLKPLGQTNTITMTLQGMVMTLFINGHVANSVSDSDYTHGQVALFVSNGQTSNGVTALFSSVVIYPLAAKPPA